MGPAVQATSDSMQDIMFSLLKAMNRIAKDHNQQPQAALLACKGAPKESPTDADYSSGPWFMFHALNSTFSYAPVIAIVISDLSIATFLCSFCSCCAFGAGVVCRSSEAFPFYPCYAYYR